MKTKPFNIEDALNGAPCVTRSGYKVTEISCFDDRSIMFPIRIIFIDEEGKKYTHHYTIDGCLYRDGRRHLCDLLLIDEEIELYCDNNKSLILKKIEEMQQYIYDDPAISKYQYYHLNKNINDLKELIEKS